MTIVDRSESLSRRDKELTGEFVVHLRAKWVSTGRLAKYAFHLKNLVEQLREVEVESARRRDIERLSVWIQEQEYAPHTVTDYFFALKYFFKFVRSGNTDRETSPSFPRK